MKLTLFTTLLFLFAPFALASTKSPPPPVLPKPSLKIADASTNFNDEHLPSVHDICQVTGRCDWGRDDLLNSPYWGVGLTPTKLQEYSEVDMGIINAGVNAYIGQWVPRPLPNPLGMGNC